MARGECLQDARVRESMSGSYHVQAGAVEKAMVLTMVLLQVHVGLYLRPRYTVNV